MKQWTPARLDSGKPRYLEIAEAIGADIEAGVLEPGDRLPPQRRVAQETGLDFSTVSRGYAEAVRRGYIESFVGRGTFVRAAEALAGRPDPRRALEEDPMMNMPPEPDDPALLARMQEGLQHVSASLLPLLRYQSVTGSPQDRAIAAAWMQANGLPCAPERLVITPGAHASIYAILTVLCEPGSTVLCEDVTYPGLRSIAARLGLRLVGLAGDKDGIRPEALAKAVQDHWPAALYLNPTLQNPTTRTMPAKRRQEVAAVLQTHDLPLIEDDAYCFVDNGAPQPVSSLIPGLGWHIAGISKCFGAGLRLAYTTVPERAAPGQFSQALRAMHVMVSPLNLALLGRWIEDGTAAAIQKSLRKAAAERQALAGEVLKDCFTQSDPLAFNLWLTLPRGTSRAELMGRMAGRQIGIMPSDAFTVSGVPEEAVRVCLGGPIGLEQLRADLMALNDAVTRKDWLG
ncbi:PLP-dependent aminotransferase family protein [Leisingera aquaemixtae]|uniref:aminotransferase-like domain-containing protein n=1 Tax=Leisingera aquaemixtae TaxID=1396826 RepID=UPI0021A47016|nr:PLP-dependent aminotransferase family protein [Leisingera aquaemixtae]UWQ38400.1 PLP-dependent aminotransferase family protein [Leisingera aquaemixtae]